jgi:hypothetical protein
MGEANFLNALLSQRPILSVHTLSGPFHSLPAIQEHAKKSEPESSNGYREFPDYPHRLRYLGISRDLTARRMSSRLRSAKSYPNRNIENQSHPQPSRESRTAG